MRFEFSFFCPLAACVDTLDVVGIAGDDDFAADDSEAADPSGFEFGVVT